MTSVSVWPPVANTAFFLPWWWSGGLVHPPQADGAIWKGDLRTGEGEVVITCGQSAGLDYDKRSGYLFVSGAFTGRCLHRVLSDSIAKSVILGTFRRRVPHVIVWGVNPNTPPRDSCSSSCSPHPQQSLSTRPRGHSHTIYTYMR